ncbi:thiamine pyrophosphate-dependent dehydrogenase E1 component subunit alpha [Chloroflexota bacterium]
MVQGLRAGGKAGAGLMDIPEGNGPDPAALRDLYHSLLRLRRVEERIAGLIICAPEIQCPVHLYTGQEAVAAGVCAHLQREDQVLSTHRSHGHYLAKGGSLKALMAELYGRATGCSRGRGGSMHLAEPASGLPGSSAIVGGTIPLAVGAAWAFSVQETDNVSVAFFGDGATNEGVFYECLNLAALRKLPVIFVCENNLYSTHLPVNQCLADTDISKKASIFNMPGVQLDGNDVTAVYRAAGQAIAAARVGQGPALLECLTYRWRGHVGPNYDIDKGLRSPEELARWQTRDPVKRLEEAMLAAGSINSRDIAALTGEIDRELEEALAFALASPFPDAVEATQGVFKS